MESLKSTGLKISGLSVERVERATQPVYPYVKPTDPYKDFLGEVSPVDAALMHEVAFLRLGLEDGSYSLMAVSRQVADFAMGISHLLKGREASDIKATWDMLYRYTLPVGRAGLAMHALSAINVLMYDALARSLSVPVYTLLGGPTRERIRAYASHLHPLPKDELEKEALGYVEEGYRAMKMRFIAGPADPFGVEKNLELLKTVREAIGYDIELAADAWMSWNVNFAERMLSRAERYELSWMEEPLLPDDFEGYRYLTRRVGTRISAGEHHYHVYDFLRLLQSGVRILQPDALWVGGITPMMKVAALAEAFGAVVIPHTSNIYNLHCIISEPVHVTPMAEYLTKYREWLEQHAVNLPKPHGGFITLSREPGFGVKYDFE
ncbi:mandelate racemase [Thermogymnomonas acidicola]|uniref:Mandelate racemase n=1 Tax=Thermogymnomonas acidicola TaxID=399579 RepID=A0AA37F9E1_9ARCH|nr:enolase C-terminal domain-like protein [Thermogymnomonas acidicola]GGM68645.1 mandelate racemase [Thermogymnomonas acidicola]